MLPIMGEVIYLLQIHYYGIKASRCTWLRTYKFNVIAAVSGVITGFITKTAPCRLCGNLAGIGLAA